MPDVVARLISQRTRKVQCTYQLSATLDSSRITEPEDRFDRARTLALKWLQRRLKSELGWSVPHATWDGAPFEIQRHGQFYAAASLPELGLWTCRFEHDDQNVAARNWTVDFALRRIASDVIVIARCLCTSPPDCNVPAPLTVLRIVRELAKELGLVDAVRISGQPWLLKNSHDLELLQLALSDAGRRLPFVLLTEAGEHLRTYKVTRFVLDHDKMAADLLGLAHVALLPRAPRV